MGLFSKKEKRVTICARVSEKIHANSVSASGSVRRSVRYSGGAAISGVCPREFYIDFILENGKSKCLQVKQEFFNSVNEGDKGLLVYEKHYFISFEKSI